MNCNACIANCKGDCCGPIPLNEEFLEENENAIQRKVIGALPYGGKKIVPITESGNCPFLKEDYGCAVYDKRPYICKKFGDETDPLMTCSYQDKDGRVRSRQERRHIERVIFKRHKMFIRRMKAGTATKQDKAEFEKIIANAPEEEKQRFTEHAGKVNKDDVPDHIISRNEAKVIAKKVVEQGHDASQWK